jgi:hypothetical protein
MAINYIKKIKKIDIKVIVCLLTAAVNGYHEEYEQGFM